MCALHLTSGPDVESVKDALQKLQARHPFLQAGIVKKGGALKFEGLNPVLPVSLTVADRKDEDTWRGVTEDALNTTFDPAGPLMKCWYLAGSDHTVCELIVCFHHAIIDGISARLLLHELLSLAGGLSLGEPIKYPETSTFPPAYQKWSFIKRVPGFMGRQMQDEWRYKKRGVAAPIPADPANAILSFRLSPEVSRKLSVRIGREGLSLNSVLLATIAKVVSQHRHQQQGNSLLRLISFADLRASMTPPVSDQTLGCYVSMLRFSVPVSPDQSVLQLSGLIRKALFKASRQGDVFMMSKLSKYVIRMVLKLRNMRLGVAALSFIGKLDLEARYGSIQLHNVNAFISNNPLGAEFSAFGKILFGSVGVDFNYLTSKSPPPISLYWMVFMK
ncbi:MAG TPA: condensation domain-containing protein, partial [Saprospiraceae bacterium]|nr:condensation domain-containing protein [Saprospiraceae bacterium]HMQ85610.1 condensation domain-containing protein [Saprospiraceae bacterium]